MHLPTNRAIALVLVILFFGVVQARTQAGVAKESPSAEPHDFQSYGMDCRTCHISVGLKTSGNMQKPIGDICGGCHKLGGKTHPVDIKPSFSIPPGLPLDEHGMLTCATCHDPHRPRLNALTGQKTMYLRRDGPKKLFCITCHYK